MKKILSIVVFAILGLVLNGQNYIQLSNATGIKPTAEELTALQTAADNLVAAIPPTFQNQFKVYDYGFYVFDDVTDGVPQAWENAKTLATSPYYLLFGRELNQEGKLEKWWVDVKLPDTGKFYCIDQLSDGLRENIRSDVELSSNNGAGLLEGETLGMNRLEEIIPGVTDCCEGSGFTEGSGCSSCLIKKDTVDNEPFIPHRKIFEKIDEKGFATELVSIVLDDEYDLPLALKDDKEGESRNIGVNATVNFFDKANVDMDGLISEISTGIQSEMSADFGQSVTVSTHFFKYPRDCGSFESKWDAYENDNADIVLFTALININGQTGVTGFHFKTNVNGNDAKSNSEGTRATPDELEEALEGLTEIADECDACQNLVLAFGNRFEKHADETLGNMYLSDSEKGYYRKYYDEKERRTKEALSQANITWSYYYQQEYNYLIADGSWRITAWIKARTNLCIDLIHTILDICGVIEPIGIVCDGTNAIMYALEGDKTNSILSAVSVVPIVGNVKIVKEISETGMKMATKVATNVDGSVKVVLQFSYKEVGNAVHWVGGHGKLKKAMKKINVFKFNDEILDAATNPVHHLIPWSFVDRTAASFKKAVTEKLAKVGWHPSDPNLNGFVIPDRLPNGGVFHGSHKNYNDWVGEALEGISKNSDTEVVGLMDELAVVLRTHIEEAYNANMSLHEYFNKLPNPYK